MAHSGAPWLRLLRCHESGDVVISVGGVHLESSPGRLAVASLQFSKCHIHTPNSLSYQPSFKILVLSQLCKALLYTATGSEVFALLRVLCALYQAFTAALLCGLVSRLTLTRRSEC